MIDEITGLEFDPEDIKPSFTVVDLATVKHNVAGFHTVAQGYSIHESLAAAKAEVIWNWARKYPHIQFGIMGE